MPTKQPFAVYRNKVWNVWIVKWKSEDGKWRTKQIPSHITDEADAKRFAAAWFPNRSIKHFNPQLAPLTVSGLCQRWTDYLKAEHPTKPRKWKDADCLRRLWIDPFPLAQVHAETLTLADCVRWVEALKKTDRAPFTVRNAVQQARQMMADARGHGWVLAERSNHFADDYLQAKMKGAAKVAGDDTIINFSLAEARRIVGYQGTSVTLRHHATYVLAICTGMRAGELSGLSWSHVDLDAKVPTVEVTRQITTSGEMKPPKKGSYRTIPLHPCAVAVLRKWKAQATTEAVFPGADGKHVYTHLARVMRKDLKAYGVPLLFEGEHPFTFHALRRTFATLITDAGAHPDEVRGLMGHAARGVTRKSYVAKHLDRFAKAIARLPFSPPPLRKAGKVIDLASRRKKVG